MSSEVPNPATKPDSVSFLGVFHRILLASSLKFQPVTTVFGRPSQVNSSPTSHCQSVYPALPPRTLHQRGIRVPEERVRGV